MKAMRHEGEGRPLGSPSKALLAPGRRGLRPLTVADWTASPPLKELVLNMCRNALTFARATKSAARSTIRGQARANLHIWARRQQIHCYSTVPLPWPCRGLCLNWQNDGAAAAAVHSSLLFHLLSGLHESHHVQVRQQDDAQRMPYKD